MIDLLLEQPLLLLFSIAAISYPLGRMRVFGISLGVAAALFVGLGFGALHPQMRLPDIIWQLGLVLFVYTVGLMNGPTFFASFKGAGVRYLVFTVVMMSAVVAVIAGAAWMFDLSAPLAAGLFAGSLTNTPALAAVVEYMAETLPADAPAFLRNAPVVGYSVAYPVSVLGMIVATAIAQRIFKPDYAAEALALGLPSEGENPLRHLTIRVTRDEEGGISITEAAQRMAEPVVFGRIRHDEKLVLATSEEHLRPGDLITAVGTVEALEEAAAFLGEISPQDIALDRTTLDARRMFISSSAVAGRRISDLALPRTHGAIITRVRRGDADLLPTPDLVLQLGDRVRVLAERSRLPEISRFFGDSMRRLSEVDLLSFNLGLGLGILLGLLPIPLPGGITARLGLAGGPLLVALVLGARGRTGPVVWTLPYGANLTLRQVGLVLFLSGIGTRAGYSFFEVMGSGQGVMLMALSATIIATLAILGFAAGHYVMKLPMSLLTGLMAGVQGQPATLGFALEQARNEGPNVTYASVFPFAIILKIIVAQLLLILLPG